jgi:hypothetical protein
MDAGTNDAGKKLLRKIYNANKCIFVIMILGINSSHGLAVIQKTVRSDFNMGRLTWWLRF